MRAVWIVALLAGCGRIGFDATGGEIADAPLTGDAPFVCPPDAILCEDFEAPLTGWSEMITAGGALTITPVQPHRGAFALEAQVPIVADGSRSAHHRSIPLQSTGTLATRLWVRTIMPLMHYDQVLSWFGTTQDRYIAFGANSLGNWEFTEDSPASGLTDHESAIAAAVGTWTCLEILIAFGSPARAQMYVDNVLLLDEALADPAPAYREIFVGLARVDVGGGHVVVDDLVVASSRIGCP